MRDLEQEQPDSVEPLEGFLNLTRQVDSDEVDQLDVDLTILDFLAYKANDLVFEWRSSSNPYQSDLPSALVTMCAEWRTFVQSKHQGRRLNIQAGFRSRLLQFVLLFSHRLNHDKTWTTKESLDEIRAQNEKRGSYWRQNTSHAPALRQPFDASNEFPLSGDVLAANRHGLASALDMPHDRRRWVTDLESTPPLHCLLSLFIELTAARVSLGDWVPTPDWFDLAGQFMLQAVTEEYLRNGASGEETFNTIFAFGCPGIDRRPDDGSDVQAMRHLFCTEGDPREQVHGWSKMKRQFINELLPRDESPASFLKAMTHAQDRFPYAEFEQSMLSFLKYLHDGLVKPDLVQVEEGRINIHGDDLPEADTREMIRRMRL
ncbi:hypothetical protein BDV95DRAFT_498897 [Massariosphaeria phaeospora]|uniref:Uncharacterized protein n=1 Tax=Massariosphaeria phaeospora TaxID=100035 RepID=A0A7C8M6Q3_9PLEO|nr:hypothetical protein BDV95DRAFT_498897 [Massariosphaeria phaeospora]